MLAIRLQRTGRKGHAQFRVIVQDARRTPTSGRVVATLGNYNPHTKTTVLDKEKVELYLKNGAQPSDRIARLFKSEDIKLPTWVKLPADKNRSTRNADKLRKNQPAEAAGSAPEATEEAATEAAEKDKPAEKPAEDEAQPSAPEKTESA